MVSVHIAIETNTEPKIKLCPRGEAFGIMNCGNRAARNSDVFGLSNATRKPARNSWTGEVRLARAALATVDLVRSALIPANRCESSLASLAQRL